MTAVISLSFCFFLNHVEQGVEENVLRRHGGFG